MSTAVDALPAARLPRGPRTLRNNISWTLLGSVIYMACQWGMLVLLTRAGSPELAGRYSLGLAVAAPVIVFANLNLRLVQVTDARGEHPFEHYFHLRLLTTSCAVAVVFGIAFFAGYPPQTLWVILALAVAKGVEAVSDIFQGLFQRHERLDLSARGGILKGMTSLVAFAAALKITGSVGWASTALAAVWLACLVGYDMRIGAGMRRPREARGPTEWSQLLGLVRVSFPLGVAMLLGSLMFNIPRYLIERQLGERELGIFAAVAYLLVAGNLLNSAVTNATVPRLSGHYARGERRAFGVLLLRLLVLGLATGGGVLVVTLLAGRPLLTLLYGAEYARHVNVFLWLIVSAMCTYMSDFLGTALTCMRRFAVQVPAHALAVPVSLAANYFGIQRFGLAGAGYAAVAVSGYYLLAYAGLTGYAISRGFPRGAAG